MKIQTECIPCLIKRVIFEVEQSTSDKNLQIRIIQNICHLLGDLYDPDECSAYIATKVHQRTYQLLKDTDPYVVLKDQSNSVACSLVADVTRCVAQSKNPIKTSMICAIVGNILDFGIDGGSANPGNLTNLFYKLYREKLGHDDFAKVQSLLEKSRHLIYFTDNSGEIVFDKIVCQELKKAYPELDITLVVRGKPVLSDATLADVKQIGFDSVVDRVLTTGCFAVGVDFRRLPKQVKQRLDSADLIVCKGMANYETFSETRYKPILYLLRTKCSPIARSMGLPVNKNIIKLKY
ncbi:MAG: ARMT1-like domain-containing protein [Candidatus Thermoplasmatota archaeon]